MPRAAGTLRLFIDEVVVHVRGGRGGDGCVSFRREKFVPKGGPDGGDGGRGGSVVFVAKAGVDTLLDLSGRHHYFADNGRPGAGANRHGKSGEELLVTVPTGTLIYDADTGRLLKDLVDDGQRIVVAKGGRGGFGNTRFATSTHQTPRESQPGLPGVERRLRLELKLIADVGFVGLPNAGKSTLLSRFTNARPKIADYPFTTKTPQLGIAELPGYRRLVLADIPGLIEGAHEGVGLGDTFLRHIERTRLLVHLVDLCPPEGSPSPAEAYRVIRQELEKYSPALAEREEILVGTKLDLTGSEGALASLQEELGRTVHGISGVVGSGLRELLETMWTRVQTVRQREEAERPAVSQLDLGDDFALSADEYEGAAEAEQEPRSTGEAEERDAEDPGDLWDRL